MPAGLIVKALSGYYYVLPHLSREGGGLHEPLQCRARGIMKNKGISPLVGDQVIFEWTDNDEGVVDEILPRSSELIRPPIANVNQAILVFSLREPDMNELLLDKFLVHTEHAGLETLICFSKQDLMEDEEQADITADSTNLEITKRYEQIGYKVVMTSAVTGEGVEQVRKCLNGNLSVFSGQSGVGKSTLLNAIIPGLTLETNAISTKLGRGKHTTRHVELMALAGGGYVADTPGFSQLDFAGIEAEELSSCFKEFNRTGPCKFRGCLHQSEPGCEVKAALHKGQISDSRYQHYSLFLQEIKDRKRRY